MPQPWVLSYNNLSHFLVFLGYSLGLGHFR